MNLQTLHSMFSFLQVLDSVEMCCSGYHQRPASPPALRQLPECTATNWPPHQTRPLKVPQLPVVRPRED